MSDQVIQRRARIDLYTPEEVELRDAAVKMEQLGAHPLLTDVTSAVWAALEKLHDWVDAGRPGAAQKP